MKYFTPEELSPSEKTLYIIRKIARIYRYDHAAGGAAPSCMN